MASPTARLATETACFGSHIRVANEAASLVQRRANQAANIIVGRRIGLWTWAIAGSIWKIRENFRVRKRAGFQSLRRLCR
jgi:hypothetical protein